MATPRLRGALAAVLSLAAIAGGARVQVSLDERPWRSHEAFGQPGFELAGVPIYGALPAPRARRAAGEPEPAREWIVMLKPGSSDGEVHSLCEERANGGACLEGHPSQGGVPFTEVSASDAELEAMLRGRPGRVEFVEADLPCSVIPEVPGKQPRFDSSELWRRAPILPARGPPAVAPPPPAPSASSPVPPSGRYTSGAQVPNASSLVQARTKHPTPWGIKRIGAQSTRGGGQGTHIYVLDTGVRVTHKEFEGRAIPALETAGGEVKECDPEDWKCAQDWNGHGTHCASTAGGATTGVAGGATIHAVKVFNNDGSGLQSWVISALDWIIRKGKRPAVASLSLGSPGQSHSYKVTIDLAMSSGVTVVVAAGNENDDACQFSPAFVSKAITVGATDSMDHRSGFSNFGSCVNLFAPGSDIVAASQSNDWEFTRKSGTSMACPHVAGAAARLLAEHPDWDANAVMKEFQRVGQRGVVKDAREAANLLLVVEKGAAGGADLGPGLVDDEAFDVDGFITVQYGQTPPKYVITQSFSQSVFSGDSAFVAMSSMPWVTQATRRGPLSELGMWIDSKQKMGFVLASLRHSGQDRYDAVLTKGSGISDSSYQELQSVDHLQSAIRDAWGQGKSVIDISWKEEVWMLVVGRCSEMIEQSWEYGGWQEVETFIGQKRGEHYSVTTLAKDDFEFFAIVTKVTTISDQVIALLSDDDCEEFVRSKWEIGFEITTVLNDRGGNPFDPYVVVMSKAEGSTVFPNSGSTESAFEHGMAKL